MKQSKLPIKNLIDFQLGDDCVYAGKECFTFYRFTPPNMDVMTEAEVEAEVATFKRLLDTLKCDFTIFATDKVEDMSHLKSYYRSLDPLYSHIISDVIAELDSAEAGAAAVQKAFYFVFKGETPNDEVYSTIASFGYRVYKAEKPELAQLIRGYFVREFYTTDIYSILQEVKSMKGMDKAKEEVERTEILRRLLPYRIDFKSNRMEQSGTMRKTVAIKNFPAKISAAHLLSIGTLRNTTFTMRLEAMNPGEARKLIDQQIKNSGTRRFGSGTQRIEAEAEISDFQNFYSQMIKEQGSVWLVNIFVEIYGKNLKELEEAEAALRTELLAKGITYENLSYEQRDGFKSVQPFGKDFFPQIANNMPSATVAALYPFSESRLVHPHGMPLGRTDRGGAVYLDFFQRDNSITNSVGFIAGASGQGKSYLQKKITALSVVQGTRVFIVDPENEYAEITRGLSGQVVDCSSGANRINVFEVRRVKAADDDDPALASVVADETMFYQHLSWLKQEYQIMLPEINGDTLSALMILTQEMYNLHGISSDTNFESLGHGDYPTFTDLYNYISGLKGKHDVVSEDLIKKVLLAIHNPTFGELSSIFNGVTTVDITEAPVVCFSMAALREGSQARLKAVEHNLNTYIWNIVLQRKFRILLCLDELYLYLAEPMMAEYISYFARRARKYNAAILVATTMMGDCLAPSCVEYAAAIINNAAYKFMFFSGKVDQQTMKQTLGFTEGELAQISQSHRAHCLLKVGNNDYCLNVGTMPFEDQLFGQAGGR